MKITALFFLLQYAAALNAAPLRHDIRVSVEPAAGRMEAEDRITLPEHAPEVIFSLHKGLSPSISAGNAELKELAPSGDGAQDVFSRYSITLPDKVKTFTLKYGGEISHPLTEQTGDYARSFSETPGLISSDGVYLSGAAFWYPQFESSPLFSFRLETDTPENYDCVSGGSRLAHGAKNARRRVVWDMPHPQDELTLSCGEYTEYRLAGKNAEFYVFLRKPDEALAKKYLTAGERYTAMYSGLLGAYPYGKFALVENFWETGYGLPSFSLLGPRVIRLPFILNSSYPHEILHNWWGNGVFVDYDKGNWCEGLTAYLADYLTAENRGKATDYRATVLQKYADYVRAGKDFPLREFRSRRSSASEAVGYGKSLMFHHMLRRALGDEKFKAGLRELYARNKFRFASFDELKRAFETQTGAARLDKFFEQWVDRAGAPELALKNVRLTREMEEYVLDFTITQVQDGPPYQLEVPVAVQLENIPQPRLLRLIMAKKEESFRYASRVKPAGVRVDPEFDLFRKLNPLETPPTLSRLLGADSPLVVLPSQAPADAYKAYGSFAAAWSRDKSNLPEVKNDSDMNDLPKDRSVWILGRENKFYSALSARLQPLGARFLPRKVILNDQEFSFTDNTFVFADLNPADPACSYGLILTDRAQDLGKLAPKLPHYGKYGYLVFDKDMAAVRTGGWLAGNSPLAVTLSSDAPVPLYPRRPALAVPAPVFSAERMEGHLRYLASEMSGRGPGEPGLERAYNYIQKRFRDNGLKPFFGTSFSQEFAEGGRILRNLAAVVPGSGRKDEYLVISAHYDHLAAENGRVFPGADDNASGVALMLELARHYSKEKPERSIVFAAFDGEEAGRLGSRHFVKTLGKETLSAINAVLNLDSIGRLNEGRVMFLNSASSDKWAHIFRGASAVTGTDYDAPRQDLDSSDQASFIEAGIPGVQVFSGISPDYHKATDTADKIDHPGMVKTADLLNEIIEYLAGDSEPLSRPGFAPRAALGGFQPERKVSTGLVPAFDWDGKGVKAASVSAGSPLEKAGFPQGGVVVRINGVPTEDLSTYSSELKKYTPGDRINMSYIFEGQEKELELELAAK